MPPRQALLRGAGRPWFATAGIPGGPVLSAQQRTRERGEWCRPLTYPDPEERECAGSASRGRSKDGAGDDLGDTHTAFARIVAGLRAESEEPRWPAPDTARDPAPDPVDGPAPDPAGEPGEDHFDPPEPPPLPVPRPRTVGGVLTLTVGVLLLVGPSLLGLGARTATPLGLLALIAGIGWLVIGLRPDPPDGSDDGARL